MARISWYLHRIFERLTPLNWMILLLLLAIIIMITQLLPLSAEEDGQAKSIAPAQLPAQTISAPILPASVQYMQKAPVVAEVTVTIAALAVLAEAHQLPVREVGYQDLVRPDSELLAYQINFSVDADYHQLRDFLADTLMELPYLAIQQLTIQRDDVNSRQLRGDLQLTLYMRSNT